MTRCISMPSTISLIGSCQEEYKKIEVTTLFGIRQNSVRIVELKRVLNCH